MYATTSIIKQRAKIKDVTKRINKYMRRIGIALGIDTDLTTYSARHSFSTMLKRSGASTEFIGESLGHKDKRTTENYLDSFEDETKLTYQNMLLEF
jgi:integrase/recombinase XerD